jgi:phosphomevalonate kinase
VAAASCGALFEWAGLPIDDHRAQIFATARVAHSEAQGGVGSGADVATSVFGGTIVYTMDAEPSPIEISGIVPVFVWSGKSASTTGLLAAVHALESADPIAYRERIDALIDLATRLAAAYHRTDPDAIVELTGCYAEAMAALGEAAGAEIVVPEHERIGRLATACGGAAKPSGAGGGDLAVAVFAESSAAEEFRDRCRSAGLVPIEIAPGEPALSSIGKPRR